VPLLLADGLRLPESLPIITWALERRDPQGWLQGWSSGEREAIKALIAENDGPFKRWLDRYRYGERGGGNEPRHAARTQALAILRSWSALLARGGWLLGDRPSLADLALLPFVRQFRLSDPGGFDNEAGLAPLQQWLAQFLRSPALAAVMEIPWAPRCPWPSPRWLYHLALADDWREARAAGTYRHSSRGLSLEAAGFVHACQAHQIASTLERFYGDLPKDALRLLAIDPDRLAQAGVEVRWEAAPESGEPFPHLYGGLPLEAVLWSEVPGR
jgi:glutathione S-transferase